MKKLAGIVSAFTRGIARSRVSLVGAVLVTVVFPLLFVAILYDLIAHIDNTYIGALIYMVLGPTFIGGLVLVFLGLFFFKGKEDVRLFTQEYLRDFFTDPTKFNKMRRLIFFTVFLAGISLFVISLLAYRGYHYMESNAFCGKFCHTVMAPEYTAYQNSPHSRVDCVECHIGSGATWFVKSKISGARQLAAVAFDTYPKPIKTPVHGLRPARDTCEECHRPEKFHGDKLVIRDKFLTDEENTHVQSVLMMKIGSAGERTTSAKGIHWHVAPENKITYKATDWERTEIPEVILQQADGTEKIFRARTDADIGYAEVREMDCIDCHNRPTHIYLPPGRAIDNKILEGKIPATIPFIKKKAMEVVQQEYTSQDEARARIAADLSSWYTQNYPEIGEDSPEDLQMAIAGIQEAYRENVFPAMNVKWNTYTNHIGHTEDFDFSVGCVRCHNDMHETESGEVISMNCDTCHLILAQDEEDPEILRSLGGGY
ncbi:MAG: NapC/NirT family cytochrome c [Desulfuromonadaceae bacterium]|nr:NapC/NirT family cytochrome c [Desulfuromonadaceae bacterium]